MPLYQTNPHSILFLDIETVSARAGFSELSEDWQKLWDRKTLYQRKDETAESYYGQRAGILAEFGKVICISCGFFSLSEGRRKFRVKSFAGHDEEKILQEFADMLKSYFDESYILCAHNGKEFDFPFLARRMLINGIVLPKLLNTSGMKPWEVRCLDTMEMWKFGDYKNFSSLNLLAKLFDIPTPKDDIDGSMVGEVYWQQGNLDRIVQYCQKDTITVARLYMKMEGQQDIVEEEIIYSE